MAFWTEIHWHEGMFLRPHHLQSAQRWLETVVRTGVEATRPFAWGFLDLKVAPEPMENFTLRIDRCDLRFKDGTWASIPENTTVAPLDFKKAMEQAQGSLDIYLGVPRIHPVQANSVSLEKPEETTGTPRYAPIPVTRRDENTGSNPQTIFVRRMRGQLFVDGEDMTGYEVVRLCRVRRTDRPGALPELDELGAGPLLAIQADAGLSALIRSLSDQVEAKDEVLAREARELHMLFTDGVVHNTQHLLKLHVLNEARTVLAALLQSPRLHPFDVFVALSRLVGHLSVFHEDLVPGPLPLYDHDRPGVCLQQLKRRIETLLESMDPRHYVRRDFSRKRDERGAEGLEVELDRKWIDEKLDLFLALDCQDRDTNDLYRHIYSTTLGMKLASPKRAPRIASLAVKGLTLEIRSVPAGTLPLRQGLHYFKIAKVRGTEADYWEECEQERGIRMSIIKDKLSAMEQFKPALYVVLKGP